MKLFIAASMLLFMSAIVDAQSNPGDLMWSKHTGRVKGDYTWATNTFKKVGDGWNGFTMTGADGLSGAIYGVKSNGDLMWSKPTGRANGDYNWATSTFKKVGDGWNGFIMIAPAGKDGIIYGITPKGELMWCKHTGMANGDYTWATSTFKKVGDGWNGFVLVAASGNDGVKK